MNTRVFEPGRLDVETFAAQGAELEGRWPLSRFDRVAVAGEPVERSKVKAQSEAGLESEPEDPAVVWHARGERLGAQGAEPQSWLHLDAAATIELVCQRCLAPVQIALRIQRKFRFVHGEDEAAALDAASAEDVLAMPRSLDLRVLIEDELVLALPLVPLHSICPTPLNAPAEEGVADEAPHPFAGLAALKRSGRLS